MGRLLDGICDAIRNYLPFMSSRSSTYHSPHLFSCLTHVGHGLVLWMGWERDWPLWQHPTQMGKPLARLLIHSLIHSPLPPWDKSQAKEHRSWSALSCAALGEEWCRPCKTVSFAHANECKYVFSCSKDMMELLLWRCGLYFLYIYCIYRYVWIDFSTLVSSFFVLFCLYFLPYFTFFWIDVLNSISSFDFFWKLHTFQLF